MTANPFTSLVQQNNIAFSSSSDQAIQYREAFLGWHNAMLGAATALQWSGNGTVVSAANNITTTAHVVFGTEASQPISYAVYQFGTSYILLLANNANTDVTPNNISLFLSGSPYALAGAPLTTRPVPTIAGREDNILTAGMMQWATAQAGFWNSQYSPAADGRHVLFFVKAVSLTDANFAFFLHRIDPSGANGGDGGANADIAIYCASGTTVFANNIIGNAANWKGLCRDQTAMTIGPNAGSRVWDFAAWVGGLSSDTRGKISPIHIGAAGATTVQARDYGLSRVMVAVPPATIYNASDPSDPVGDALHWRTIGDVAILWPKAAGDLA